MVLQVVLKSLQDTNCGSNQNKMSVVKNNIHVGADSWPEEIAWENRD